MTSTTTTTTAAVKGLDAVIDTMRSIQTEGDRWNLADELRVLIPSGNGTGPVTFGTIIDTATKEGVAGKLSVNTLRLYRDTAVRWVPEKRVPNVSFSAHREAQVLPSIDSAVKMLKDLAKVDGPDKVTVASVRKAVAIKQGKTGPKASKPTPTQSSLDVMADLRSGGGKLIATIGASTDPQTLDELFAGLQKVTAHVEKLRAKNARAKASAKKSSPTTTTAPTAKVTPAKGKGTGDIRGL